MCVVVVERKEGTSSGGENSAAGRASPIGRKFPTNNSTCFPTSSGHFIRLYLFHDDNDHNSLPSTSLESCDLNMSYVSSDKCKSLNSGLIKRVLAPSLNPNATFHAQSESESPLSI